MENFRSLCNSYLQNSCILPNAGGISGLFLSDLHVTLVTEEFLLHKGSSAVRATADFYGTRAHTRFLPFTG